MLWKVKSIVWPQYEVLKDTFFFIKYYFINYDLYDEKILYDKISHEGGGGVEKCQKMWRIFRMAPESPTSSGWPMFYAQISPVLRT